MKIRRLRDGDIPRLAGMVAALAAHHGDEPGASEAELRRDCLGDKPWLPTWVAEENGRIVGYAAGLRRAQMQFGRRGVELHHLYVDAASRGSGAGRALVAALAEWAQRQGCDFMTVGTDPGNRAAQGFYLGLGFQPQEIEARRFWRKLEPRNPGGQGVGWAATSDSGDGHEL